MIYSMVSSCPLVLLVSDRLQALWAPHDFAFWRDSFSSSNGSMQHSPRRFGLDLLRGPVGMLGGKHTADGVAGCRATFGRRSPSHVASTDVTRMREHLLGSLKASDHNLLWFAGRQPQSVVVYLTYSERIFTIGTGCPKIGSGKFFDNSSIALRSR